MKQLRWSTLETPLGMMIGIAADIGLVLCEFVDRPMLSTQLLRAESVTGGTATRGPHDLLEQAQEELREYFAGDRQYFTVPLVLEGSSFQTAVWKELLRVPYGTTTSYEAIARRIHRPGAARAVGRANGDNRMAIIVPCHRVINSDGRLSGYGGGKHRKRRLLELEGRTSQLALDALEA